MGCAAPCGLRGSAQVGGGCAGLGAPAVTTRVGQPSHEPCRSCRGQLQGAVVEVDGHHAGLLRQAGPWLQQSTVMDGNNTARETAHLPGSSASHAEGRTCLPRGMQGCSTHLCSTVCAASVCAVLLLGLCAPASFAHSAGTSRTLAGCQPRTGTFPPFLCLLATTCGLQVGARQHCLCAHGALCTRISSKGGLGSGKQLGYQWVVVMLSPCPCSPPAWDRYPGEGAGPAEAAGHLG